jgi:hypothetical protein
MSIIQGTSKSSAAAGYSIDQSIRFNDDDSAYLSRTPGSAGNRKTWTFSSWVKRANLFNGSVPQIIFSAANGSTLDFIMQFGQSDDTLRISDYSSGSASNLITTQLFRDPSAWYHFVLQYDTTQATSSDRMKLYVNGTQVTAFSTASYPSLNYDSAVNNNLAHNISRGAYSANGYFDGYQAEINFIDGTALDPTSFGETNADTGQWVPVKYAGSYGTNGFYLKGQDSSALGDDSSGNNNDFTSSGLTAADQMLDTPTDNFCTLNPLITPATMTFTDGNLALSGYTAVTSAYGTFGMSSGKWYWELVAQTNAMAGVAATPNGSQYPGQAADSYAFDLTNGTKYNNGSSSAFGAGAVSAGDTVGVAFDADSGDLKFYDNSGTLIGTAFSGLTSGPYFPVFRNGSAANISINFGQQTFSHSLPTSHVALSTSNLPDPTIADPSAYFQTSLWNGNGSTQTITQDGNSTFQPGWIWSKGRNNAQEHVVFDEVRGTTKYLKVSPAGTEATQSGVTAFNSDGFDLGSWAGTNGSGQTHVGWQWKAGGTSGSSNTDGSITSTVSADTTSGFSIVSYTGTGANATVGHGLGVAPSMVICKQRNASRSWVVYHEGLPSAANVIYLDLASAPATDSTVWNSTDPTSTVFSVGSANGSNSSGNGMIAYCFAEVEGFSKFGIYTGNGSTNGAFVYTGFKPAFVLWKQYTNLGTNSWGIRDSARDPSNVVESVLRPNTAGAETTASSAYADFLSNGFKLRATDGFVNKASSNYLYYAVAESPFKTATAR